MNVDILESGISGENSNIQELNNEDINKLLQKYADETRFNCSVLETSEGLISSVIFTKKVVKFYNFIIYKIIYKTCRIMV